MFTPSYLSICTLSCNGLRKAPDPSPRSWSDTVPIAHVRRRRKLRICELYTGTLSFFNIRDLECTRYCGPIYFLWLFILRRPLRRNQWASRLTTVQTLTVNRYVAHARAQVCWHRIHHRRWFVVRATLKSVEGFVSQSNKHLREETKTSATSAPRRTIPFSWTCSLSLSRLLVSCYCPQLINSLVPRCGQDTLQ